MIPRTLAVSCWIAAMAPGQSIDWQAAAGGKMSFEVAAVKPSKGAFSPPSFPLDAGDAFTPTGGRFHADFPVWIYINFAYKLTQTNEQREAMLGRAPKWVSSDRYAIEARAEGNPTKDQIRLMMQSLLKDRFQLEVHFETPRVPLLALILVKPGKPGPNLRPHADGPACDSGDTKVFPPRCDVYAMQFLPSHMNHAGSRNTTMDLLASAVPGFGRLARPVVDQTGLSGRWDFEIQWVPEPNSPLSPDSPPPPEGPTFLEALREQLGLRLETTNGPVRILVIDHIDLPSAN